MLKAKLPKNDDLPIAGRPAIVISFSGLNPPSIAFRLQNPVVIPDDLMPVFLSSIRSKAFIRIDDNEVGSDCDAIALLFTSKTFENAVSNCLPIS